MHKPLNAQNFYNLQKAVYVRTIRLTRKIRTTYAKPYTYAKSYYIAQSRTHTYAIMYNLRKAACIAQSRTRTYEKAVQPTQSCIHFTKRYKYVRKIRT